MRRALPLRLLLAVVASALFAASAQAQPWARFAVPDSALVPALRAAGTEFEPAWNALLVAEIRATLARADSASSLAALERRLAAAEPRALPTRIGLDAMALRRRWKPAQLRLRVAGAVAESLGLVARNGRRFVEADSLYRAALATWRTLREKRREAWALGSLGVVALVAGDMPAADTAYREALAARRRLGDPRMLGNTLYDLGQVQLQLGRNEQAEQFLQEARMIRERLGERAPLGNTLNFLGLVAARRGQPDSALVWFERALALTVASGDSARTLDVLANYMIVLTEQGRPGASHRLAERALVIARQRGDRRTESRIEHNIGFLLRQQGRYTDAAERLAVAIRIRAEDGEPAPLAASLLELGRVNVQLLDPERGRPPLERALALADSLGDAPLAAQALNNLAILAQHDRDLDGATRLAQRALDRAAGVGDSLLIHDVASTIGNLAFARDDLPTARTWWERAARAGSAGDADHRAYDLSNLGVVAARQQRLDEADARFREAQAAAVAAGSPDIMWKALLGLGDVAERRKDFPTALRYTRLAATLIDTLRGEQGEERPSITLLARRMFVYEELIHLLGKLAPVYPDSHYDAEAFVWAERARARSFLDLVEASGGAGIKINPLSLGEARGLLGSDREALLEYSVGDSSTSLWVVTRAATRRFLLPAAPAMRARAEILRRGLGDPASASSRRTRTAASELFERLIAPAMPMLANIDHLVIAPDGTLALIPFEALLVRPVVGEGPAPRGAFLVERFSVSYTPSATALATRLGGKTGRAGIVALGNPRFAADSTVLAPASRTALVPLPSTGAEVEALRSLAGKRAFVGLTGAEATRERLLATRSLSKAEVIHIATHGEANEAAPERSGLWLAAGPAVGDRESSGPGFLSVSDILDLRLDAGLVTLSACETGLGRLERGEGVVGLSRAFMAAGARSVVVSLWKVNDRSSALLMERFYAPLLARGMSLDRALATAKRSLLASAETRSPYYWAPFVLVGSSGALP